MRRFVALLAACGLIGGGFLFLQNYEIRGLDEISVVPREGADSAAAADSLPPARKGETIRIASFNIQVFGQSKLAKQLDEGRPVLDILAQVARKFDVVAIQEVRSKEQNVLPEFVRAINATGRQYGFIIGERQGRTSSKEQYAFVYDMETVEVDKASAHSVSGFEAQLHRPPYVAWFRARGPPEGEEFTFVLVNIHTDPDETKTELNALDDVIRQVREDARYAQGGQREDDFILLGDLNVDDEHLGDVADLPYVHWVISSPKFTNTRQNKLYDNIIFNRNATEEYTDRAGVLNLMQEFSLTRDEAIKVSDHFPVWAEFSAYEGGSARRIAARAAATTSQ